MEIIFDNKKLAVARSEAPPSSYAQNTGNFLDASPREIEDGWSRLFSCNLEALKAAAVGINS